MLVEVHLSISASKSAIWAVMTDIANAAKIIRGIEKIEILEKPAGGLVGLKWRETRMLFGKAASVDKWITDAVENESYTTRAEEGGFVFLTTMRIAEGSGGMTLTSSHETKPQGFIARLKGLPMILFKGVIKRAIAQDLNDIKTAVEKK